MTNDWDIVMHLAEAAAMIIFGVGAWSAQRKAGETTNATDIARVTASVGDVKHDLDRKVDWKDFDRVLSAERRVQEKENENICERVERLERKVFNGGSHG